MITVEEKIACLRAARERVGPFSYYLCNIFLDLRRSEHARAASYWREFVREAIAPYFSLHGWAYYQFAEADERPVKGLSREEMADLRRRYIDWLINCLENP